MNNKASSQWEHVGLSRPEFAIEPAPGQESVWDYPRPPCLQPDQRQIIVRYGNVVLANSKHAFRLLETASPPAFYLPDDDVDMDLLISNSATSFCEWKGKASYYDFKGPNEMISNVAWSYESINKKFEAIQHYLCFYPSKLECYVDDERVKAQQSEFYGGWITEEIVGPFKGGDASKTW